MYCLDTNVLINSWHFWYAPATHPTFWTGLQTLAGEGRLGFPYQVYEELELQHDDLWEWCRDRRDQLMLPATEESEQIFAELAAEFPDLIGALGLGQSYADLYVVAMAESRGWVVVSTEELSNSPNRRKWRIPNICRERGVDCIQPYSLIQREGWVFNH